MNNSINKFTILCERCTGSHFLQYAVQDNFNLKYYKKNKHFFGHTDNIDYINTDDMIYFCLVRNPIEWIDSFFKRLHNVPPENKKDIYSFTHNEFYSIYEEGDQITKEIMEDRHIKTNERYKNILELRETKQDYILNTIPNKVKHFMLIKYEDLRDDYENTLNKIKDNFNLIKTNEYKEYKKIEKYKGSFNALYYKKPILINDDIQNYIKENINIEQEKLLGYLL